jgi:hypothetical protein
MEVTFSILDNDQFGAIVDLKCGFLPLAIFLSQGFTFNKSDVP